MVGIKWVGLYPDYWEKNKHKFRQVKINDFQNDDNDMIYAQMARNQFHDFMEDGSYHYRIYGHWKKPMKYYFVSIFESRVYSLSL